MTAIGGNIPVVNAMYPMNNPYYMMGGSYDSNNYYQNLNFSGEADYNQYREARINDWQTRSEYVGYSRRSQGTQARALAIYEAMSDNNDTEVRQYLEGLEPEEVAGLELNYNRQFGEGSFRRDLRDALGGHKSKTGISELWFGVRSAVGRMFGYNPLSEQEAFDIVNKGAQVNTDVAANALYDATDGFGTDEKTVEYILNNSRGRMNEINRSYTARFGRSLTADIRSDYQGLLDGFGTRERTLNRINQELVA